MTDSGLTFNQTVQGITEFLEVAIHQILYLRQVYPADLFVRRKKYDTAVFQSRHPTLNEYISGAVKAVGEELVRGTVDKVVVVIKDKEQIALERFIFSIDSMIEVEAFNKDTSVEGAMSPRVLGQYFRSFLVKLSAIESQLGLMEEEDEVTFAVVLELKEEQAPTSSKPKEPAPWIPANIQDTTAGVHEDAELHLMRAVDTGVMNLSLAIQESAIKLEREATRRRKALQAKAKAAGKRPE